MKASLIWPAFNSFSSLDDSWIPTGVTQIATECNARGHTVEVLDGRLYPVATMQDILKDTASQVIGISALSAYTGFALDLINFIRKARPDIKIVVGGIHPTVSPDDFTDYDWLIKGEGEITFRKILDGEVPEGIVEGEKPDLAEILPVDRSLIRIEEKPLPGLEEPFATLIIGRGCPWRCNFCQPAEHTLFGKRLRMRPVENVVAEIESLGVNSFMIHDDCFTASKKYVNDFCDALPDSLSWWCQGRADNVCDNMSLIKRMRDKGLRGMILGHESGDDRVLQYLKKDCTIAQNLESARILKALGVIVWSNIMLGVPHEPPSSVINTILMLAQMEPEIISTAVFTPHPGSELYDYCTEHNMIPEHDWSYYNRGQFEKKIEGIDYEFLAWALSQMRPGGNDDKSATGGQRQEVL